MEYRILYIILREVAFICDKIRNSKEDYRSKRQPTTEWPRTFV